MNIETLIRDANPVAISDVAAGDSPQARRALEEILTEPVARRRLTGQAPRIALAGLAAVVAAVVLAFTVQGSPAPPGGTFRPNPAAATALRALALAAAAQPAPVLPGPGQYLYVESESVESPVNYDGGRYYTVRYHVHGQTWIGSDGSGRGVQVFSDPTFPTRHDRASWLAAGSPSLLRPRADDRFGAHSTPGWMGNVAALPANPAKLAEMISARKIEGGPAGPAEDFVQVGDLLRETLAPPALRSALFQVAAQIPGVKVLGTVTDSAGQSGVGIVYVAQAQAGEIQQNELIFNRVTGALLAEQTVSVNIRTSARTLTSWTDYLSSGVVDSISSIPPSGSGLTGA
jgi:hypothetical protein